MIITSLLRCPCCNNNTVSVSFCGHPDDCNPDIMQQCDCDISVEQGDALIELAMDVSEPDMDYILSMANAY